MINNLLFGQYSYKDSIIHRLDPRLKIICLFILSILVFLINNLPKIIIFTFFITAFVILSKITIDRLIKSLKPFYLIFVFIFLMYFIFSRNKLLQGLITIWRFLMLIIMSFVITYTTTISDLIAAVERLIMPLKIFNIKPRNIAVMISITIRFVPVMFINIEKLKAATLSRLADFRKLKNIKLLMLCLLERMLRSASNLSDAMQSRLYNEDIGSIKHMKFQNKDYLAALFVLMLILVIY